MSPAMAVPLVLLGSFLSGSVPFAWITTRAVRGIDLRTIGSGNVGATNAGRVLGRKWFFAIFAVDALKGALPVLLLAPLAHLPETQELRLEMGCGLAAILGHVYCPWLGWKGGKGVATGGGVVTAIAPLAALLAFGLFLVALFAFRFVSLASCIGCVALAPAAWALGMPREVVVFLVVVGAFVVFLHRPNLGRIAAGTEPKAFGKKDGEAAGG